MKTSTQEIQPSPQVFFMPSVFGDTMKLLTEARDYFQTYSGTDQENANDYIKAIYASEMSRITLRLSTVMAWTMAQRAVLAGKLTQEEAVIHHSLSYQDVCRVDSAVLHGMLPDSVCTLLDRSYELYERVARLDERFRMAMCAANDD